MEPLYTQEDALGAHGLIHPCHYGQRVEVCPGVSIRMVDVGHLLGSASIEVTVTEGTETRVIVFSGDIGNLHQPLLRDPQYLHAADLVVMESTYAGRTHGPAPDTIGALTRVLQETFDRGGNVVIPSFAVGRTQEMLYFIRQIKQEGRVHGHDGFPVYVDSPLGIEATTVFNDNTRECADEETLALLRAGVNPLAFDGLRIAQSAEESKLINTDPTPKVILSASGMCDAGRVRHHLKHNLWRPECTVLFVGYQSVGTLGRSIVDGAGEVRLFGETVAVNAHIETLAGVSGHADNAGLMRWISAFEQKPRHVFVVHGEDEAAAAFAGRLQSELGLEANAPYNGESWDLLSLTCVAGGNRERLRRPSREAAALDALPGRRPPAHAAPERKAPDASTAYGQLVLSGEKLSALIRRMQGRGAKQQSRLARQINLLIRKFGGR